METETIRTTKRFRLVDDTKKVMRQGTSNVVAIPKLIFKTLGLKTKDPIKIYWDSERRIIIEFNGDE